MQFEICKWENSRSSEQKSNSNCDRGLVVSYSSSISKPFHRIQYIYLRISLKNYSSVKQVNLLPYFLLQQCNNL